MNRREFLKLVPKVAVAAAVTPAALKYEHVPAIKPVMDEDGEEFTISWEDTGRFGNPSRIITKGHFEKELWPGVEKWFGEEYNV